MNWKTFFAMLARDAHVARRNAMQLLMQTFLQAGERALALRQYHACRKVFRDQIGVEPSDETRALYAAML